MADSATNSVIYSATVNLNMTLKALVLNSSYEPLRIITWQKAIIMWFQDKVEILEYHATSVRSIKESFQLLSVLKLKTYIRPRKTDGVRFCRENVYIRGSHTCQYCAIKFPYKELTIDHVVPASHGGPKTWTNVVTACRKCNQIKAIAPQKKQRCLYLNHLKHRNGYQ